MPSRVCNIAEILLGGMLTIAAACTRLLLYIGSDTQDEQRQEMSWLLLPLIGSGFAALVCFLFNPAIEDRRSVGGRVVGGMFFGAVTPNIVFYCSATIQKASIIPAVPLTLGFIICGMVFLIIKPLFRSGYFRSTTISEKIWDKVEHKTGLDSTERDD